MYDILKCIWTLYLMVCIIILYELTAPFIVAFLHFGNYMQLQYNIIVLYT